MSSEVTTGTIWQIVINNPTDEDRALCGNAPGFVKEFLFQDEVGDNGTLHVNGALKTKYSTQFKAIKKWLPRAHISKATSAEHASNILKYAHKTETSVEGTQRKITQETFTAHKICIMLARTILPQYDDRKYMEKIEDSTKILYNLAIKRILMVKPELAGQFMNPSLRNFWCDTLTVWIHHARAELERDALISECAELSESEK
jgi:hypothetical protein